MTKENIIYDEATLEPKVKFKDLSIWLKIAIVFAYVFGSLSTIAFAVGFIQEILRYPW